MYLASLFLSFLNCKMDGNTYLIGLPWSSPVSVCLESSENAWQVMGLPLLLLTLELHASLLEFSFF